MWWLQKHRVCKDKWCVMFIHNTGGHATEVADTPDEAVELARGRSERWPKQYVLATIPYAVRRNYARNVYDVTVPQEIKASWPDWILELYGSGNRKIVDTTWGGAKVW